MRPWLLEQGSLTLRLQRACQQGFSLRLLASEWGRPFADEALLLGQPLTRHALQREVLLFDGARPQIYARTVIPLATYRVMRHRFDTLGSQPLGEMLFNDPTLQRGPIEIACVGQGQRLYAQATATLELPPPQLWARRSLFYLAGHAMLVNEIFLPSSKWTTA